MDPDAFARDCIDVPITPANDKARDKLQAGGWDALDPRQWTEKPPDREWIVDGWIPRRVVTGLYGDGATGKTTLEQQLMTSMATQRDWIGLPTAKGRTLALFCEDDDDEHRRRQWAINNSMGVSPNDLGDMRMVCRFGRDNVLMRFGMAGETVLTDVFEQFDSICASFQPDLVILDPASDLFGGNEVSRNQARQFVQQAPGAYARKYGCGVLVGAHPSQYGKSSGEGTSGSTGWNNAFRSRLYLERLKPDNGLPVDDDVRILSRKKANYGPLAGEVTLRWQAGMFVPVASVTDATMAGKDVIGRMLDAIEAAAKAADEGKGMPYSSAAQTEPQGRYLPALAPRLFGVPKREAAKLLQGWINNGHVMVDDFDKKTGLRGLRVLHRFDWEM